MRCAPQVHGAVRDVLGYARRVIETELGSVVDNPVIVPDGEVMTTGNFHGEPLAFAADMLAMAISELASISERRVDRMLDPASSRGLPPFLAPNAGTNSGYMLAQYTAASLVSENKVLAHPASVDTIPTSGKQEDHVSMGWTAVRKLRDVLVNVRTCLAVEILCAVQGIDLRSPVGAPSGPLAAVRDVVRARVPMMAVDREVSGQIVAVDELIPEICETAAGRCGRPEIGAARDGVDERHAAGRLRCPDFRLRSRADRGGRRLRDRPDLRRGAVRADQAPGPAERVGGRAGLAGA